MKKLLTICFSACLPVMLMVGCSGSPPETVAQIVNVNNHLCQSTKEYTAFAAGSYTIKIFEPNDSRNPDIWQGPVCISSEPNKVNCGFDLSLVKSVKPTVDMKEIEVVVFSGSSSHTVRIVLANCQVK